MYTKSFALLRYAWQSLPVRISIPCLLLVCACKAFAATYVGGLLRTDTTWPVSGSPYILSSDVQIGSGITLTIDPGVTVNGSDFAIRVAGTLSAHGVSGVEITFNDAHILNVATYGQFGLIDISHAQIIGGSLYKATGHAMYGNLLLRDSVLKNIPYIYLWYPIDISYIERNVFFNTGGIDVGIDSRDGANYAYIRNNVFQLDSQACGASQASDYYAVKNWAAYNGAQVIMEYNSFLTTNRVAVGYPRGYTSRNILAINNYWNTTDPAVIDGMIYDGHDDVTLPIIDYTSFLTAPHPDTPTPLTGQTDCSRIVRGSMNRDIGQYKAICANQTTRQIVTIPVVYGQTWDCSAAGLTVNKGDNVTVTLRATIK